MPFDEVAGAETRIHWCGDAGLLIDLPDLRSVQAMYAAITADPPAGTVDIIPAARTVMLKTDPDVTALSDVERHVANLPVDTSAAASTYELVEIPVTYDGQDLASVAELTRLSVEDVIGTHTGADWQVAFCGFAPGFAYLVNGNDRLVVPRRGESRTRVPPGAVALAGGFTAVYPRESPGGWQIIGHTSMVLWDTDADPPARLRPGMVVRFIDIGAT